MSILLGWALPGRSPRAYVLHLDRRALVGVSTAAAAAFAAGARAGAR